MMPTPTVEQLEEKVRRAEHSLSINRRSLQQAKELVRNAEQLHAEAQRELTDAMRAELESLKK